MLVRGSFGYGEIASHRVDRSTEKGSVAAEHVQAGLLLTCRVAMGTSSCRYLDVSLGDSLRMDVPSCSWNATTLERTM